MKYLFTLFIMMLAGCTNPPKVGDCYFSDSGLVYKIVRVGTHGEVLVDVRYSSADTDKYLKIRSTVAGLNEVDCSFLEELGYFK